ncbi:MAG TPA: hypothetical protein VFX75_04480, partial [Nitrososphaeraceae archaeon]|nr:hypothetical protein [Nitrososphaeraceae archaeon]
MNRINSMFSLLIETIIVHLLFGNVHSYLDLKLDIRVYLVLFGVVLALSNNNISYAHNFYQNDSSVLYTLLKQFEVEKNLALENQYVNNSSYSIHSEKADELFDKLASIRKDITENSIFPNHHDILLSNLNLTTKALVSANIADESLREYGLSTGLDSKMASGLLNMSIDMIMKMNETSTTNMTDIANTHSMEKMTSRSNNQSISNEGTQENKVVKNLANYETSVALAKSLKILFTNYLQDAKLEKSTGLMSIPTGMKINAIRELGQGIDNLVLALN